MSTFEQVSSQFLAFGKTQADAALKAQSLTLAGLERIADIELQAFESQVNATVEFLNSLGEIRDFESARTLWPRGFALVKQSAEKAYATNLEVFDVAVKTNEALGTLAKEKIEATNEALAQQVSAVKGQFEKSSEELVKRVKKAVAK